MFIPGGVRVAKEARSNCQKEKGSSSTLTSSTFEFCRDDHNRNQGFRTDLIEPLTLAYGRLR